MPVFEDRTTGKLYKRATPLHTSDALKPGVTTELEAELTATPVHAMDTAAVKKSLSKHWGGRRS